MTVSVKLKDVPFAEAKAEIQAILQDVDAGVYDEVLKAAGVARDPAISLADAVTLSKEQNLSVELWQVVLGSALPVAAGMVTDVWKIVVVPKLKRVFREDQVQDADD